MAASYLDQQENADISAMSFDDRFGLLVDREYSVRENNRLTRLIRNANYPSPGACLEDIEYHSDRHLDKELITKLGTCNYIADKRNVIIQGATGTGKTYLACALGMAANRQFYSAKYVRLPDLLVELQIARLENNYGKVMAQYQKYKLLIFDEWLLYPLKETEARDLLELAERRYQKASTIFCSQFAVAGWCDRRSAGGKGAVAPSFVCGDSPPRRVHNHRVRRRVYAETQRTDQSPRFDCAVIVR
jgi:DNA replication protein DnaC